MKGGWRKIGGGEGRGGEGLTLARNKMVAGFDVRYILLYSLKHQMTMTMTLYNQTFRFRSTVAFKLTLKQGIDEDFSNVRRISSAEKKNEQKQKEEELVS